MLNTFSGIFPIAAIAVIGGAVLVCVIRLILGPKFTDRILLVNMINTMTIAVIAIIAVFNDFHALLDIALIFALFSFFAVTILAGLLENHNRSANPKKIDRSEE